MESIPITVIGGYLGAGKTTLVNSLLRRADGRRLGVIVNDFGDIGVDADLIQAAIEDAADGSPGTGVISLANGCVCCTLGDDLRAALSSLAEYGPDHIVIEASGVADPVGTAAWSTVPPFLPGGIIVLAAADTIRAQAVDHYVGGEVRRQLAGADLVVLTKADRCGAVEMDAVERWLATESDAPVVQSVAGDVPVELVLDPSARSASSSAASTPAAGVHGLADRYVRWSRTGIGPVGVDVVRGFASALPDGVLRLKGVLEPSDGADAIVLQVVGRTVDITRRNSHRGSSTLVAIGVAGVLDPEDLDRLAVDYFDDR